MTMTDNPNEWNVTLRARIEALTAQLESTLKDRAQIIAERDRTFALMLARAEKAEADNARLLEIVRDALDAWDTHHKYGDPMQGHWASDARAALTETEPSHE
jgi:hypothetical protein